MLCISLEPARVNSSFFLRCFFRSRIVGACLVATDQSMAIIESVVRATASMICSSLAPKFAHYDTWRMHSTTTYGQSIPGSMAQASTTPVTPRQIACKDSTLQRTYVNHAFRELVRKHSTAAHTLETSRVFTLRSTAPAAPYRPNLPDPPFRAAVLSITPVRLSIAPHL